MVGWHHQVNNMSLSKLQEMVKDQETWHAAVCGLQRVRHDVTTELNGNELKQFKCSGEMKLGSMNMNAAKITRLYLFPLRSWEVQSLATKIS